uniref:Uncharacterized protein n=1 Tax=Glossina austeni TaxID=7395 RepID=A0A1A9VIM3_GLOAU
MQSSGIGYDVGKNYSMFKVYVDLPAHSFYIIPVLFWAQMKCFVLYLCYTSIYLLPLGDSGVNGRSTNTTSSSSTSSSSNNNNSRSSSSCSSSSSSSNRSSSSSSSSSSSKEAVLAALPLPFVVVRLD